MNIYKLKELSKEKKNFILRRAEIDITEHMKLALEVSERIRKEGDSAVLEYTEKFDRVKLTRDTIKVKPEEIEQGYQRLDGKIRETIAYAAKNIRDFHEKQLPEEMWFTNVDKGLMVGEKVTPIVDVCLYVPRGKGSFPSVLLMLGIPAVVAKVPRIVVVTPPNEEGNVDDTILAAAKIIGISEIYKVGGIQAVASVAFGTETIPKCHKIIGPGNAYATAAKRVLSSYIDTGLPAGPSESIILADEHADPEKVALDWMIEAEHGPDSAALLVTHSEALVERVIPIVERQLEKISPKRKEFITTNFSTYGGVIITESLKESIDFVNEYAPEHMEIMTQNPFDVLPEIKNAGEILLGEYTPITLCNFLLGPNAILPTGGFAKTYSSVSVFDFLKRSSIGYASKEGFERVRDMAYTFATAEGFDTHALAVKERK
ncbi:MAG: histidinol dehydrogenase [Petroclostridium sp.]|jgi:histidinol dehydrogenase|uniref:histidinol dehydrogenase n=1 Tax=Petroclostridium xylanilyticum TaxID=1792311 RepID=UPI000B987BF2|nr:histidinol dehydrogenase [Petroclostridium xylanilyticum]MBZ4646535.1 histidinol dehydrogenase [Clostridia bacterium]MDK2810448.1 histidinol dehydrogenase [Petroclostridium sp.]